MLIPQQRIDSIRARYRVSDVARRLTQLRKAGAEWAGLCPFHKEKSPSFYVNDMKRFAHCFGCGWHGDIIRLCEDGFRLSFPQAVDMIDGAGLPPVDPRQWAKEKEIDDRLDSEAVADALRFWEDGGDIAGTPADAYLMLRRISARPDAIRFNRVPTWKDPDTGRWNRSRPALLLKAENLHGEFVGIQRIMLTEDGQKAPMEHPKLTLGRIRSAGGAVRFGRPREHAIVTGSPEDGLTLYQRHAELETVYVSCGESNLPFLRLPRLTRKVTVARQNDKPGRAAERKALTAFREQGRQVFRLPPPPQFKDWNDQARGAPSTVQSWREAA